MKNLFATFYPVFIVIFILVLMMVTAIRREHNTIVLTIDNTGRIVRVENKTKFHIEVSGIKIYPQLEK